MKDELKAVIATLPLLSKEEQREFYAAVNEWHFSGKAAELKQLQSTAMQAPVDKRVAKYVKLRDERATTNKAADSYDKLYKETLAAIEASLIKDANEQGVKGFKTDAGTTYMEEKLSASIADENVFFNFVREQGDLDFFERRISTNHIKEWSKDHDGAMPPGLNYFRELTMKVRRS